jgi:hypothetical protein
MKYSLLAIPNLKGLILCSTILVKIVQSKRRYRERKKMILIKEIPGIAESAAGRAESKRVRT